MTFGTKSDAFEFSSLSKSDQATLQAGNVLMLERRPGEAAPGDKRFVTVAKLIKGSRKTIWEIVIDKDNTDKFLDGVLESRIVKKSGNEIIVEQRTHVGGPKGSYKYTLKYLLFPEKVAEFTFVKGEIKNAEGAWWIFDGPTPDRKLVVYALHIDPGVFAPQFVVKRGMKKTLPETIIAIDVETQRREKLSR